MKNITSDYKTNVKNFGRQIDSKISYTIEGTTTELGKEQLNSVTPHYESSILKSAMKQLDIDSNVDIPLNTTLNYQFGVLVDDAYEYINYGNYVVKSSEKQEDTNSYRIICYDKMLYSMVDYTKMNIEYPITIRDYIQAICDTIGLNFKNADDEFVNYDKLIQNELYFDAQDKSLGYKFRDVLDELAQVTGSTICINEETDELEIRYINEGVTYEEAEGTTIDLQDSIKHKLSNSELKGNTTQQTYTGKNLLANTNVNSGDNNYWSFYSTFDENTGTLTRSTTATTETSIQHRYNLKNNTQYTLSFLAKKNNYVSSAEVYIYNSSVSKIYYYSYAITTNFVKYSYTFTTDSSTDFTNAVIRFDNNGSTTSGTNATLTITDVMLVEGTNTDFEPYVGGTPSPNPDYPQPVNNVTGLQNVEICQKNLFNKDNLEIGVYNLGTTGVIPPKIANTTRVALSPQNAIAVSPETTYTISAPSTTYITIGELANDRTLIQQSGWQATSYTFTTGATTHYIMFNGYYNNGVTITDEIFNTLKNAIQIEKGQATTYETYIGKQYEINLGKNLFDIDKAYNNATLQNCTITKQDDKLILTPINTSQEIWFGDAQKSDQQPHTSNKNRVIEIKPNTIYTFKCSTMSKNFVTFYDNNFNIVNSSYIQMSGEQYTFTTPQNAKYFMYRIGSNASSSELEISNIQLEEGSQATSYSEYKTPIELCKIGDYQDYIYKNNNKWYIHKEIGKETINITSDTNTRYNNINYGIMAKPTNYIGYASYSNYPILTEIATYTYLDGNWDSTIRIGKVSGRAHDLRFWFGFSKETTLAEMQELINGKLIYYPLATPTYTEITDTELINQLEALNNAKTYDGITHITVDGDLPSTLKISYANGYDLDTINEEYFKDINVNFGEKYGPINSIVLSRSAGSDNVYLRDEESIAEDGLHELKISDNQIMNFNDRSDYLPDLLKQLGGLEYYLNDYVSTGITYYEMCDRYFAQIGDIKYSCVMFNDEVLVTQGLVENIHTDMPEESETDYSKADKTDRKINQTNLIVNKQTGDIEALTTKTEEIEEDLSENYYTKSMTNQLIQNAETGVTNTFSEAGGNNILRNTNFSATEVLEEGQQYEYWYGNVVKISNNNSANGMSILLQNGNLYQEQQVANGTYTVSFYYKKLNPLATGKLVVNGIEYNLTEDDYTLFQTGLKDEAGAYITQPIIVNDNYLKVQFTSDTNNAFEVYDIMCNFGTVKLAYSQNQNETITNTVNISKGITITASDKDVKFVATPDGIRIKNKDTDEIITDFTDKGMDTKNAIIEETATIVGIYRQKVGDQVWDSLM